MRDADFMLDICEYWGENVDEPMLESLGFAPVDFASLDPSCYRIWRNTKHAAGKRRPGAWKLRRPTAPGDRVGV